MSSSHSLPIGAAPDNRALVVMGVSGSGKSDISRLVAQQLGWRHIEADQFHPQDNVERMRAGIALTDSDRVQWFDALIEEMQRVQAAGEGFVLSCSALKHSYRERLRSAVEGLRFAHLHIEPAVALARVASRPGHFMPSSLVDSQFATLEAPLNEAGVLVVDATLSREQVSACVCDWVVPIDSTAVEPPEPSASSLSRCFDRVSDLLMAALMAFMVLAVFANVVLRYVFGTGFAGAEELSRLAFVWLVFVGVAAGMRRGELMRFSLLRDRFPRLLLPLVDSLSSLLVACASALACWGAWQQMQYGWSNNSPVVGYPLALAMLPVLVSMLALGVLALVQLVMAWRRPSCAAVSG